MSALRVAHDIPGRLRLRLPVGVSVEGLIDAVAAQPGVQACTWSPRTRSLLVVYQPGSATTAGILRTVPDHTPPPVAVHGESPQASAPAGGGPPAPGVPGGDPGPRRPRGPRTGVGVAGAG